MTARVLMLVQASTAGPLPKPGQERRVDHRLVRSALGAETLDLDALQAHRWARLLRRLAGNYVALAAMAFARARRDPPDLILCDNENEAIVLAGLLKLSGRRVPLVTLAVSPAATKKAPFFLLTGVQTHVDLWLNHSVVQADLLVTRRGVPADRVQVLPFHTDPLYFDPASVADPPRPPRPYVLAVGRQHRDYLTLVEALAGQPVDVVIDGSSPYSKSPDSLRGKPLPESVHLVRLDSEQLRAAYAGAAVVVVPTVESDFGPGQTTMFEAMAMGRPVVTTRAAGSGDVLADRRSVLRHRLVRPTAGLFAEVYVPGKPEALGPHGFYVPPGDAAALRRAVIYLLEHPEEASAMGDRGRAFVLGALTIDHFQERVVSAVQDVLSRAGGRAP